ncbi:MAG: hypothetical protein V2B18_02640 [Pseudomonadota bacterium]
MSIVNEIVGLCRSLVGSSFLRRFSCGAGGRRTPWLLHVLSAVALFGMAPQTVFADLFEDSPPAWAIVLWHSRFFEPNPAVPSGGESALSDSMQPSSNDSASAKSDHPESVPDSDITPKEKPRPLWTDSISTPSHSSSLKPSTLVMPSVEVPRTACREPFRRLVLKNIPPLYVNPGLPGEGVWVAEDLPVGSNGWPVMFKTFYRPGVQHPNAIAHLLFIDMKQVSMRLYIGSTEPEAPENASMIEADKEPELLAVTNALWKQKHSYGAGAVYRGRLIRDLVPGMATLVTYVDDSVDVIEWNGGIPLSLVHDARQLRHLIVKDGKVVESIIKQGQRSESEIGLGFLLPEDQQSGPSNAPGYGFWNPDPRMNYGEDWFIATRSAFGIRRDGNLVFAMGHHISTKDLAKALVLAGCVRAIHGDANPHNVLANLYYTDGSGRIVRKEKLSPLLKDHTLRMYVKKTYTSDFYGFFKKTIGKDGT